MNKKVWSIILLCVMTALFVGTAVLCVHAGISFYELENTEIDPSHEPLPGASVLGVIFAFFALGGGSVLIGGTASSVGFFCSLVNVKIAQNIRIRQVSKVFLYVYSAMLILIIGTLIYFGVSLS